MIIMMFSTICMSVSLLHRFSFRRITHSLITRSLTMRIIHCNSVSCRLDYLMLPKVTTAEMQRESIDKNNQLWPANKIKFNSFGKLNSPKLSDCYWTQLSKSYAIQWWIVRTFGKFSWANLQKGHCHISRNWAILSFAFTADHFQYRWKFSEFLTN